MTKLSIDTSVLKGMLPVMLVSPFDITNEKWQPTVSPGVVLCEDTDKIYHSCVSQPGWSGAPLISNGKVLGVHNGRTDDNGVYVGTHINGALSALALSKN